MELKKWKKKEKKLNQFLSEIQDQKFNPKIHVSHLVNFSLRLINDSIIMVSFKGMKILQELAKGLRGNFKGHVKSNIKSLLAKLNSRQQ